MSRKYPIGIQSFEKLRSAGYVYVDKTRYVWQLVQEGEYYFMSRPRRFGKSLLISTLEAFFRGRRDLFAGLYIDGVDYDWTEYPV
ncbi:MAG: AAA family ATPase, partial [Muribaculaceae bacterium]|nr:AAA family ATPase [Muribaculaceae bacterium]